VVVMAQLLRLKIRDGRTVELWRRGQRLHDERFDAAADVDAADDALEVRRVAEPAAVGADAENLGRRVPRPVEEDRLRVEPANLVRRAVVLLRDEPGRAALRTYDVDLLLAQPVAHAAAAEEGDRFAVGREQRIAVGA